MGGKYSLYDCNFGSSTPFTWSMTCITTNKNRYSCRDLGSESKRVVQKLHCWLNHASVYRLHAGITASLQILKEHGRGSNALCHFSIFIAAD